MEQITITKTKNYLVLRIPTKALQRRRVGFASREERAIQEGLKALEDGKISMPLKGAKKAIAFLRGLGTFNLPSHSRVILRNCPS